MNYKKVSFIVLLSASIFGCTKLDEKLNDSLTGDQAAALFGGAAPDVTALLRGAYDATRLPYQDQSRFWAAEEHTSDEAMGPTRGGDWDDNGVWRVMHSHRWDADHSFLSDTYRDLGRIVFATTDLLRFNPPAGPAAEARFLRAFAMYSILDGWDQVPYREPNGSISDVPKVRKGLEALDYVIAEVNAILPNLPDGPAYKANKDAARVFLMKCYLNKGVIANRAAPTFAAADMAQVITLADGLISSGKYSLANNFYDNFAPGNDGLSTENIFTAQNIGGSNSGNVRSRWFCTLHYNNNPSGWNGFTTLSDFYDKFDPADKRRGDSYTGVTNVSGLKVGLLFGQQFDQNNVALKDRKGNPLFFTKAVSIN